MMNGDLRSSWVVEPADGHLPNTPLAKAVLEAAGKVFKTSYDNPEERPGAERCIASMGHPPLQAIGPVIPSEIVQTPAAILIWTEDTDGARIIHLTGEPPPDVIRTRAGYSAGHWEGDTLVVETTHLSALDPGGGLLRDAIVLSRGSRIIERFSLQRDGALLYQFTVLDADLYERPWLAEYLLVRNTDHVYEYACHEGNRGMTNILKAARVERQTLPVPGKADTSTPAPSGKLNRPALTGPSRAGKTICRAKTQLDLGLVGLEMKRDARNALGWLRQQPERSQPTSFSRSPGINQRFLVFDVSDF